jgi:hypothetical protein
LQLSDAEIVRLYRLFKALEAIDVSFAEFIDLDPSEDIGSYNFKKRIVSYVDSHGSQWKIANNCNFK